MTLKIAIAGASGFIGRELMRELKSLEDIKLVALSRQKEAFYGDDIEVRQCDLFSLRETEEALEEIDIAIYLVHSMLPSAKLAQGNFSDFDLILADNFARSAQINCVKRVVFISGIMPQTNKRSKHLESRHEVEEVIKSYDFDWTILRAGLIVGKGSSSYAIVERVIKKIPIILSPKWTESKSQPIFIGDLLAIIKHAIQNKDIASNKVFDVGCEVPISYLKMMKAVADNLGLNRRFIKTPFFPPSFARPAISLLTSAPKTLIGPLLKSLRYPMLVRPPNRYPLKIQNNTFDKILKSYQSSHPANNQAIRAFTKIRSVQASHKVCSVQRIPIFEKKFAAWVVEHYCVFLTHFFRLIIYVKSTPKEINFYLFNKYKLLQLTHNPERSSEYRHLYYISDGLLVNTKYRGRFEFRKSPFDNFYVVAIYDFVPSLPWLIYRYSQAIVHLIVMKLFQVYMLRIR